MLGEYNSAKPLPYASECIDELEVKHCCIKDEWENLWRKRNPAAMGWRTFGWRKPRQQWFELTSFGCNSIISSFPPNWECHLWWSPRNINIYIYIYIYIYTHTHTIHKLQMFSKFSKKIYKMNDIVHFEPNMFAQL